LLILEVDRALLLAQFLSFYFWSSFALLGGLLKALLGVRFSTLDGVLLSACLLGDLRRVLEGDLLIMLDLEFE